MTIENSEENPKIIDAKGIVWSPAKKRATIIDTECIIMGEELTDLEINLAQQLLKKQFANINGLQSTLLQDKGPMASNEQKTKLQIVFCKDQKHWVVATNINCVDGEVKVYDSVFQYLDRTSLRCIESLVKQGDAVPQYLKLKCHNVANKQAQKTVVFTVYAIAFAAAITFGKNPHPCQQAQLFGFPLYPLKNVGIYTLQNTFSSRNHYNSINS